MGVQHDNFLHPFRMRVDRVDMQVAKTQGQRALLLRGNGLFTQEYHLMTQHRVVQLLKLVIAQRTGYVGPDTCAPIYGPSGVMVSRSLIVFLHAGRQATL